MIMKDSYENFSKYRTELMGIAALGVLAGHSTDIVRYPIVLQTLLSYGAVSVYIFAVLSGMGLYYSLKKRGAGYSKWEFYKRRMFRVFLPYLLIAGTWYGIKYLVIERSISGFIYELSTLSYWMEHKGAWYVAMLLPAYLLFPFLYDFVERKKGKVRLGLVYSVCFTLMVLTFYLNELLYKHLFQVMNSVLLILSGYYIAKQIESNSFDERKAFLVCLGMFAIKTLTPLKRVGWIVDITYAYLSLALMVGITWLFNIMHNNIYIYIYQEKRNNFAGIIPV